MKTSKLKIAIGSLLITLVMQTALAWYDPSTGRWLTRDPIGEPGFETLYKASAAPRFGNRELPPPSRWVNRDPRGQANLYLFVENNPITEYDIDGRVLGRRDRSTCDFWDALKSDSNKCTANYATAASIVCRIAGESPWEQCQRWCLQKTYTPFGEDCNSPCSTAKFVAKTAARYAACAAACALDAGPPTRPPFPPFN